MKADRYEKQNKKTNYPDGITYDAHLNRFRAQFNRLHLTPFQFVEKIKTANHKLGNGASGTVYTIPFPGFEHYLLKTFQGNPLPEDAKLKLDPDNHLNGLHVGQAFATIGQIGRGQVELLLRQSGKQCGFGGSAKQRFQQAHIDRYYEFIDVVANFPQASFTNLAQVVKDLNAQKLIVDDSNAGNFLYDAGTQQLNIIDTQWGGKAQQTIQRLMLGIMDVYNDVPDLTAEQQKRIRTILQKLIIASVEVGMPRDTQLFPSMVYFYERCGLDTNKFLPLLIHPQKDVDIEQCLKIAA